MSEFKVQVVRLTSVEKHPNADSLSIVKVNGDYPVIFQSAGFNEGDLAVYVPIDSIVPDTEEWSFLGGHRRIKAKKLRGIFSMGMLAPLPSGVHPLLGEVDRWSEGDDMQTAMGIVKYEPQIHAGTIKSDDVMEAPSWFPRYTDIESLRKNGGVLVEGEEVVITEKIHGANGRWATRLSDEADDNDFAMLDWIVGSHNQVYKTGKGSIWFEVLRQGLCNGLNCALMDMQKHVFFGEVYGKVQDLRYGEGDGINVRVFDIFDGEKMEYLNFDEMMKICDEYDIRTAPLLYRGPWIDGWARSLAEGKTMIGGDHVREGFVVRPVKERFDRRCGRVVLKLIGEGYLLRKNA